MPQIYAAKHFKFRVSVRGNSGKGHDNQGPRGVASLRLVVRRGHAVGRLVIVRGGVALGHRRRPRRRGIFVVVVVAVVEVVAVVVGISGLLVHAVLRVVRIVVATRLRRLWLVVLCVGLLLLDARTPYSSASEEKIQDYENDGHEEEQEEQPSAIVQPVVVPIVVVVALVE